MEPCATPPRLPSSPAEPNPQRARQLRDFYFGGTADDARPLAGHDKLQAVFLHMPASLYQAPPAPETNGDSASGPLQWLLSAARDLIPPRRAALAEEIARLRGGLLSLLKVEDGKDPRPDALQSAVGSIGSDLLDPTALAAVLGRQRGSVRVDARRRQRIEHALEVFERRGAFTDLPLLTVLHNSDARAAIPEEAEVSGVEADDPCEAAAARFDQEAASWTELFRTMRTARLELATAYEPEQHDPWLDAMDWEGFTRDELLLVPVVVALDSTRQLCDQHMPSLSRLLRSGRPVHTLAIARLGNNASRDLKELFSSYRLELAFLGVGHREAYVQQTSTTRDDHIDAGFKRSLQCTRSALHVVHTGASDAAVRCRANPLFRYDPEAGGTWARRLDFSGNPDPETDWSTTTLTCVDAKGEEQQLSFRATYVDYALLDQAFAGEFQLVSDTFGSDELVPIDDFLELDIGTAARRIPFVWAVDRDGDMHRLVVTSRLVQACRDRLQFWRTLQELAGVRNEHVQQALERAQAEAQRDQETLAAERVVELERAQGEAVSQAMQRLAMSLVELGPEGFAITALAGASAVAPEATSKIAEDTTTETVPETDTAETAVSPDPWIQTPLCTSCNDCRDINPQVFVYDENKQAVIGDPRAGTYAQLVKAAEKCPARCIHPGLPFNPDEPGVKALIARAEPFN